MVNSNSHVVYFITTPTGLEYTLGILNHYLHESDLVGPAIGGGGQSLLINELVIVVFV